MAAFNCGMEALMFGSLMMLASGFFASSPKFGKIVRLPLSCGQVLREVCEDPASERDVPRLDLYAGNPVNAWTIGRRE